MNRRWTVALLVTTVVAAVIETLLVGGWAALVPLSEGATLITALAWVEHRRNCRFRR